MARYYRNIDNIPAKGMPEMVKTVSTSHPDGNWANEKNCAWLHSEKPTHESGYCNHVSVKTGRFFLHFTKDYSLIKIFNDAK
jgi:hypothetical protein